MVFIMNTSNRRDRILNALYRGATTVADIAQAFGVSERTVYRDISALRDAGHDILASPGPGGGVRIAPDSKPRAVHFEVDEIIGLAMSVAILKVMPDLPFVGSAEAALDRACRALSSDRQRAMRQLQKRILIGGPGSERVKASVGSVEPDVLVAFERCFIEARVMHFDYTDHFGEPSSRRIECVALLLHAPAWYIVAWDLDKDASRLFRLDRVIAPTCGDELEQRHPLDACVAPTSPEEEAELARRGWLRRPIG